MKNNQVLLWTSIPVAVLIIILMNTIFSPKQDKKAEETVVPKEDIVQTVSPDIEISTPKNGAQVGTMIEVTGKARGTWFFEGSLPLLVMHEDGRLLGEGYATANSSWMTTDFVEFAGEVGLYDSYSGKGSLLVKKANPSGLIENEDVLEVPIEFVSSN